MKSNITYTMAFWLLRIWLGVRALYTGLVKFQGTEKVVKDTEGLSPEDIKALLDGGAGETVNALGFRFYHALPPSGPMSAESFSNSPFMPSFMVGPYCSVLGYALIALGVTTLLGIFTRLSLFVMGLLYVSLTFGFIILEPGLGNASAAGVAYLGVHMIMIVGALLLADYNKFELLPCKRLCGKCCSCNKD